MLNKMVDIIYLVLAYALGQMSTFLAIMVGHFIYYGRGGRK